MRPRIILHGASLFGKTVDLKYITNDNLPNEDLRRNCCCGSGLEANNKSNVRTSPRIIISVPKNATLPR